MRMIDADSLIALVSDSTVLGPGFKQAFCRIVNGEPSVQPEIIRCIDCKHWHNMHVCQHYSRFGIVETKRDDYCSKGEKRNDQTR